MNSEIQEYMLKRDDTIYKDIENFQDYEYTYCIAYEMAIRNSEVIKTIKSFLENFINLDLYDNPILCDTNAFIKSQNEVQKLLSDFNINPLELYINYNFFEDVNIKLGDILNKLEEHLSLTLKGIFFEKEKQEYEFFDTPEDDIRNAKLLDKPLSDEKSYRLLKGNKYFESFIYYKEDKVKNLKNLLTENEFNQLNKEDFVQILQNDWIRPRYSRPKLHKSFLQSRKRKVEIDFTLPEIELVDFISKIKKEFDKDNSYIKNPLELLGDELDKSDEMKSKALPKDKLKRKKIMADAFYIYDTWKILEIHYAEKTKELKEKLKKEIQSIKNNFNYDKYDKKSKIDDAKTNNEFSLSNYTKVSLKTEIASQLNISIDTVDKLHTLMIKYIDNLKYKELITGLSN